MTSYSVKHSLHIEALQGHASVSGDRGRTKVKCLLQQAVLLPTQLGRNQSHYFIVRLHTVIGCYTM